MTNTKINRSDLKIFPSERLTDNEDGGGMPTGTPIQGVANELFDPISSIARVNGGFYVRKVFMGVQRADDEPLIGAFTAITKPPKDESVSYLLFPATKFGESRAEILKRIEAYNIATIESRMTLFSTQSANSGIVQAYQRVGEPLPMVGDVYCLRQDKRGYPDVEQYIQVTKVNAENRNFIAGEKEFSRTVVKMEISNKLKADFIGIDYPKEGYADSPCKLYETHVADAGQYYGVKPLAKAIEQHSQRIAITALMEKIVPVNQIETALVDMVEGEQTLEIDSGYSEVVLNGVRHNTVIPVKALVHSYKEDITLANRSYNYTAQLINPKPNSVIAKFLSQGTWYELKDDGNGKLVGASASHGSGTVNYETGAVVISCGEMPDVGSAIIVNYSKDIIVKPVKPVLNAYLPIKLTHIANNILISCGEKTARVENDKVVGDFTGDYDRATRTIKLSGATSSDEIQVQYTAGHLSQDFTLMGVVDEKARFRTNTKPIIANTLYFYASFDNDITLLYRDDGQGNIVLDSDIVGTVNYATGEIVIPAKQVYKLNKEIFEKVQVGTKRIDDNTGGYTTEPIYEQRLLKTQNATITLNYQRVLQCYYMDNSFDMTERFSQNRLYLNLNTDTNYQNLVDNSLIFALDDHVYQEIDKAIYLGENKVGMREGNQIILHEFTKFSKAEVKAVLVQTQNDSIKNLSFATPRLRPKSLKIAIDGKLAEANLQGKILDEQRHEIGIVDNQNGVVMLNFAEGVNQIRWQGVALSYLPVSSAVVKIDTVRLPQDGRVPIFRKGDTILISNTIEQNLGSAFTANQTIQLERGDLDRICLQDSNGKAVLADLWQYDLQAGSITFAQSLDLSDYQLPLIAKHTQEEKNLVTDVDIDGTLTLRFATKRAYPVENTYVSSVLIYQNGNLQVNSSVPFTQRNWNNVWQDTPIGEQLLNKLNVKDYPIVLTDDGAIDERWLIKWTSSSQFELYGEQVGFVLKTDTLQDLSPINPATKKPYFTIPKQAFGADAPWSAGDVIRFNTTGTLMPVWVLCAVQPIANPLNEEDGFTVCLFGDTTEI